MKNKKDYITKVGLKYNDAYQYIYVLITCAHNVAYKMNITDENYLPSDGLKIFLGKWNKKIKDMMDSNYMLYLDLENETIIYSDNYNGTMQCGYDIAMISIS